MKNLWKLGMVVSIFLLCVGLGMAANNGQKCQESDVKIISQDELAIRVPGGGTDPAPIQWASSGNNLVFEARGSFGMYGSLNALYTYGGSNTLKRWALLPSTGGSSQKFDMDLFGNTMVYRNLSAEESTAGVFVNNGSRTPLSGRPFFDDGVLTEVMHDGPIVTQIVQCLDGFSPSHPCKDPRDVNDPALGTYEVVETIGDTLVIINIGSYGEYRGNYYLFSPVAGEKTQITTGDPSTPQLSGLVANDDQELAIISKESGHNKVTYFDGTISRIIAELPSDVAAVSPSIKGGKIMWKEISGPGPYPNYVVKLKYFDGNQVETLGDLDYYTIPHLVSQNQYVYYKRSWPNIGVYKKTFCP